MPATLRDVARAAGVSVATASRALNGSGGRVVSAEKRALIIQVAGQLNYQSVGQVAHPPAIAEGSARRTHNLGLILCAAYRYVDPFWSPVLEGVTNEVLRQGYHIRFSFLADDLNQDRHRRMLNARHIDGLLLIGDMGLAGEIADLEPPQHIVVIAGSDRTRWESDVRFDIVTMEKYAAMDMLVGHLLALGRHRLGFLGPPVDADRRSEGFVHALARRGLSLNPALSVKCDFGVDAGYAAARTLLDRQARALDGLICACDTLAIGAMRAAKEYGLHLPGELAIAGYDNIAFSRDLDPPLTTIDVPKELMGELAARRLIDRINHPDWPPIIQMVPTRLIARASCGETLTG